MSRSAILTVMQPGMHKGALNTLVHLHSCRSGNSKLSITTEACHNEQEGLSHAKKTGDDKKLQMVASRRKKLDDRMGLEKNAKGHRLQINRSAAADFLLCITPSNAD